MIKVKSLGISGLLFVVAALGLSSCSWRWPSLHTAEAVLHCDKQVVVCIAEPGSIFKYRYKGLDWYPIKLARAIDKGKSIYRRGDGAAWCIQDPTDRYQILQESVRTCMVPRVEHCTTRVNGGMRFDQAIMEQDFPFSKAKRRILFSPKWRNDIFCHQWYR